MLEPASLFWIVVVAVAAGGGRLILRRARHAAQPDAGAVSRAWLARHAAPRG